MFSSLLCHLLYRWDPRRRFLQHFWDCWQMPNAVCLARSLFPFNLSSFMMCPKKLELSLPICIVMRYRLFFFPSSRTSFVFFSVHDMWSTIFSAASDFPDWQVVYCPTFTSKYKGGPRMRHDLFWCWVTSFYFWASGSFCWNNLLTWQYSFHLRTNFNIQGISIDSLVWFCYCCNCCDVTCWGLLSPWKSQAFSFANAQGQSVYFTFGYSYI